MSPQWPAIFIFVLTTCGLTCPSAFAADTWRAYTSENFTLYTDGAEAEAETKRILEAFEVFRDSTLTVLGLERKAESRRLLIVVYGNRRDFDRISPPGVTGFFHDSIFGPRMLMHGGAHESTVRSALFHEYVHHLMGQRSSLNYPLWYVEGLATVLMTTKIGVETITIGDPPPRYATVIRAWRNLPVSDVLVPDNTRGGFYVTSWLLSHYLLLGNTERRAQTVDYLLRYDAGEDPLAAFVASFGISPSDMGIEVSRYASRRMIGGLVAPRHQRAVEISSRTLAPDEALLLLANVAVERDRYDAAHRYFDEAATLEGELHYRKNLMARQAIAYVHEKRTREGDDLMSRIVMEESEDGQVLGDVAHYAFDKYIEVLEGRVGGSVTDELSRSIEFGLRAIQADPANVEAHYYLGLAYEAAGNLQAAADELLASYELNPRTPRLSMDLARVLIRGRQPDYASYLAARLYSVSHDEERRAELTLLLDDLADKDIDITKHRLLSRSWQRGSTP